MVSMFLLYLFVVLRYAVGQYYVVELCLVASGLVVLAAACNWRSLFASLMDFGFVDVTFGYSRFHSGCCQLVLVDLWCSCWFSIRCLRCGRHYCWWVTQCCRLGGGCCSLGVVVCSPFWSRWVFLWDFSLRFGKCFTYCTLLLIFAGLDMTSLWLFSSARWVCSHRLMVCRF